MNACLHGYTRDQRCDRCAHARWCLLLAGARVQRLVCAGDKEALFRRGLVPYARALGRLEACLRPRCYDEVPVPFAVAGFGCSRTKGHTGEHRRAAPGEVAVTWGGGR
jgi:hypothetical protein